MDTKHKNKRRRVLILCLLVFTVMCGQLYSQGTQYTLIFVNNSSDTASACVYQTDPDLGVSNAMSLAWFTKKAAPTSKIKFIWEIEYDFIWSETGALAPGIIFTSSQTWLANFTDKNMVTLTHNDGVYTFVNQEKGPEVNKLYIYQDKTIPLKMASVGIGMAGAGTFAVQAQPNSTLIFTPSYPPQYWIAFGDYTQGEVLHTGEIRNPAEIVFPSNVYSMTAILNEDNTWTVMPTAKVNAKFIKAKKRNKKARWGKF